MRSATGALRYRQLKVSRIALHHDLSEIIAVFPEGDPVVSDCPPHFARINQFFGIYRLKIARQVSSAIP